MAIALDEQGVARARLRGRLIVFALLSHAVFGNDEGVGHLVTRVAMDVATAGYAGAVVVAYHCRQPGLHPV